MTRCVKIARPGPLRRLTTSPTASVRGSTGSTTIAEPSEIVGSIEPPATTSVVRPVSGSTRPRKIVNRQMTTSRTSAASIASRAQSAIRVFVVIG